MLKKLLFLTAMCLHLSSCAYILVGAGAYVAGRELEEREHKKGKHNPFQKEIYK